MLEDNPRDWHIILSETLWAYRTSKRVPSLRVSRYNALNPQEYSEVMIMELEALDGKRLQAFDHIMI